MLNLVKFHQDVDHSIDFVVMHYLRVFRLLCAVTVFLCFFFLFLDVVTDCFRVFCVVAHHFRVFSCHLLFQSVLCSLCGRAWRWRCAEEGLGLISLYRIVQKCFRLFQTCWLYVSDDLYGNRKSHSYDLLCASAQMFCWDWEKKRERERGYQTLFSYFANN